MILFFSDLRDLKPQDPHDSLQLKNMKSGFVEQWPSRDQIWHFS